MLRGVTDFKFPGHLQVRLIIYGDGKMLIKRESAMFLLLFTMQRL
jgi:hypothetical protein